MKKNVYMMWKYLSKESFENAFNTKCGLISEVGKEGLSIHF